MNGNPIRRCIHGKLFSESCPGCGYVHPRDQLTPTPEPMMTERPFAQPRIAYPPQFGASDREALDALFKQARLEGLWFFHGGLSGPLWFTPDELQAAQERGNFVWGAPNWRLRSPYEELERLETVRDAAIAAVDQHKAKMQQGIEAGQIAP